MARWKITAKELATGAVHIAYFSSADSRSMKPAALKAAASKAAVKGMVRVAKAAGLPVERFHCQACNCVG